MSFLRCLGPLLLSVSSYAHVSSESLGKVSDRIREAWIDATDHYAFLSDGESFTEVWDLREKKFLQRVPGTFRDSTADGHFLTMKVGPFAPRKLYVWRVGVTEPVFKLDDPQLDHPSYARLGRQRPYLWVDDDRTRTSASEGGGLVWNYLTGQTLFKIPSKDFTNFVEAPSGRVFGFMGKNDRWTFVDADTFQVTQSNQVGFVNRAFFTPNEKRAVVSEAARDFVYDYERNELHCELKEARFPMEKGLRLGVQLFNDRLLGDRGQVFDLETCESTSLSFPRELGPMSPQIVRKAQDGRILVSVQDDPYVYVVDERTLAYVTELGRIRFVGGENPSIKVLEVGNHDPIMLTVSSVGWLELWRID